MGLSLEPCAGFGSLGHIINPLPSLLLRNSFTSPPHFLANHVASILFTPPLVCCRRLRCSRVFPTVPHTLYHHSKCLFSRSTPFPSAVRKPTGSAAVYPLTGSAMVDLPTGSVTVYLLTGDETAYLLTGSVMAYLPTGSATLQTALTGETPSCEYAYYC